MDIAMDRVYRFEINMTFPDLDVSDCIDILSDGRVASHFLERWLVKKFPKLYRVDQTGFDHILASDRDRYYNLPTSQRKSFDGIKYDQKSFTLGGMRFNPSNQIGAGRKFNESVAHEHAQDIIYICCDITALPNIQVIFKRGTELVGKYPKCHIPRKDIDLLFNG